MCVSLLAVTLLRSTRHMFLHRIPHLGFGRCFFMIGVRLCILNRNTPEVMCPIREAYDVSDWFRYWRCSFRLVGWLVVLFQQVSSLSSYCIYFVLNLGEDTFNTEQIYCSPSHPISLAAFRTAVFVSSRCYKFWCLNCPWPGWWMSGRLLFPLVISLSLFEPFLISWHKIF